MKQSSNSSKQPRRLTQYSSGEDDSGTEEIRLQNHDLKFSSYLHRPLDLRAKKRTSQPVLRQNRYKRTSFSGESFNTVDPCNFESNSPRKHAGRSALATRRGSAGVKRSFDKSDMRQRSSNVKARLWSGQNSETGLLDDCETGSDSDVPKGTYPLGDLVEQVKSDSGQDNDRIPGFPRLQGTLKKENSRRALSDITKETVAEFQYKVPSYFSRDVLPLDAENSTESDFSEFLRHKNVRSENNFPVKEGCRYNEHASNGVPSRSRRNPGASSIDMSREFKTTEEKGWFSLHYQKVSMILVAVVLIFFIGLGLMYLNVCFKETQKNIYEEYGNIYPICDTSDPNLVQCIPENQLGTVLSMLQVLSPKLISMAVDSYCNSSAETMMSDADVLQYVVQNKQMDSSEVEMNLPNLKLLILHNPHWDIKIVDEKDESTEMDKLLNHGRFLFKNPLLPLGCQLKLFVGALLCWTSFSSAVVVAAAAGLLTVWHYKRRLEQHRQEVYMLVNKIISAVRNHHRRAQLSGMDGVSYLPVEKCKNDIINPKHSKHPSSTWDEAVKFIDVHESRIITDVQNVCGKPAKVWQWQSVTPPRPDMVSNEANSKSYVNEESSRSPTLSSLSSSTGSSFSMPMGNAKGRRNKVWQGQAFDTIAGSPNSLPCSPTPCLKIRNMFDPDLEHGDDWPVLIQDSILEKCEGVRVLHLHVESSSQEGCVFMKCSSPEEAGKAYRALHGWWFDTKLVTVKYLRTERYHERYPEAANASCHLRPSNNQQLSLQELWHFPLEST